MNIYFSQFHSYLTKAWHFSNGVREFSNYILLQKIQRKFKCGFSLLAPPDFNFENNKSKKVAI